MHKRFLTAGAVFGGLAVALGAFGAHGLEKVTADAKTLHGFQTGVEYQLYHALALLAVAIVFEKFPNSLVRWAGNLFIAGILLFSGSLYLLTFLKIQGSSVMSIVGPVTPIGGLLIIGGWVCLLAGVLKKGK
ncbi:MAG TPA: DUF423 domain-containing protein [Chitinophagaceae bacterium]